MIPDGPSPDPEEVIPISTTTTPTPEREAVTPSAATEPATLAASLGAALCSARAPEARQAPCQAPPRPSPVPAPPPADPPPPPRRRRFASDPAELERAAATDPLLRAILEREGRKGPPPPAPPPPGAPTVELVRALAHPHPAVAMPTLPHAVRALMVDTRDGPQSYPFWQKVCGEVATRARPPESILEPYEAAMRQVREGKAIPNLAAYVAHSIKAWRPAAQGKPPAGAGPRTREARMTVP